MGGARGRDRQVIPITLDRCRDPGFTPGARDVVELVGLWEGLGRGEGTGSTRRRAAKPVLQALARGDLGVARALATGWARAGGEQRAMRLQVLGRIAARLPVPELAALLPEALVDPEPKVVREAARVVGKLHDPGRADYEALLLAVAERAGLPERRAAVEALGRLGGDRARARLEALASADRDLARRTAEALTLIARRADRTRAGRIRLDRALPQPACAWLRCRQGAAASVLQQVRTRLPGGRHVELAPKGEAAVQLRWSGPLGPLYEVRSATEVALVFPLPSGDDLSERIAAGLTHPLLQAALEAWTDGAPRFRLAFSAGGHHRSVRWAVAQRLAQRGSPLLNDSREVCWTVEVDEAGDRLLCLPRGADPRFAYRRRDVPAATHPTLAALLAWTGAPRPGEVVWDPFCGSGSELVEAARLRDGLHLRGTDVSPRALDAARLNLAAAALDAASTELRQASALEVAPHHQGRPVSLILSNPPMGRRAQVEDRRARQLLVDFVGHAARVLGPQGRMVWLSPAPRATARAGVAHGLHVEDLDAIDMGGFWATPQILRQSS